MSDTQRYLRKPIVKIYEDEAFVVFNKPAGLLIFPTSKNEQNTLTRIVNHQYAADAAVPNLHPCHRLDKETSGTILYAKGKKNQTLMMNVFKNQQVEKKYTAFVQGKLQEWSGALESRIRGLEQKRYHQNREGKVAITRYQTIAVKKDYTIVDVETLTGRNNQIRIQFSEVGNPLVGDRKYAVAKDYPLKFKRTALHARFLQWKCPLTDQVHSVKVPLPEDMKQFEIKHP